MSEKRQEDLDRLEGRVQREIDAYVYNVPISSVGTPWSAEKVKAGIERMRRCLVSPYWAEVEIRDTFEQCKADALIKRECAVVADDNSGTLLLWDPTVEDYFLAERKYDAVVSFGVRGDAVGCFLAI